MASWRCVLWRQAAMASWRRVLRKEGRTCGVSDLSLMVHDHAGGLLVSCQPMPSALLVTRSMFHVIVLLG